MPTNRKLSPERPRLGRECDREWHDYSTPANPRFAELCAMSIAMWTAGAEPADIADWLGQQQPTCPASLNDQLFAVRVLKKYAPGGVLDSLRHPHPAPTDSCAVVLDDPLALPPDPLEME